MGGGRLRPDLRGVPHPGCGALRPDLRGASHPGCGALRPDLRELRGLILGPSTPDDGWNALVCMFL
jgi:hypothetical protein